MKSVLDGPHGFLMGATALFSTAVVAAGIWTGISHVYHSVTSRDFSEIPEIREKAAFESKKLEVRLENENICSYSSKKYEIDFDENTENYVLKKLNRMPSSIKTPDGETNYHLSFRNNLNLIEYTSLGKECYEFTKSKFENDLPKFFDVKDIINK